MSEVRDNVQRQYAAFNNGKKRRKKNYGIFPQNINPCIYWVNFVAVPAITQCCYFIWKFVLEVSMLFIYMKNVLFPSFAHLFKSTTESVRLNVNLTYSMVDLQKR